MILLTLANMAEVSRCSGKSMEELQELYDKCLAKGHVAFVAMCHAKALLN